MDLLQTNICPPWPEYATKQKLSKYDINDYLEFVAALFSPHAHPIFLSFRHTMTPRAEIMGIRDDYLRQKYPDLVPRDPGLRPERHDELRLYSREQSFSERHRSRELPPWGYEIGVNDAWGLH